MSWKQVEKTISKSAPILGSLFGPIGGAIGSLVSKVLGVKDDPDEVMKALQSNPEALEKIMTLQAQMLTATQTADTERLESINQTMQQEIASKKWYDHWRSAWGWLSAISFFGFISAFVYTIIINPANASGLLQYVSAISQLFFVPGVILGVVAWHGGKQQRILSGEQPDITKIGDLFKSIKGAG